MVDSKQEFLINTPFDNHTLVNECDDIYLDDTIMSLKFSPTQNIITAGQITGEIRIYSYREEQT